MLTLEPLGKSQVRYRYAIGAKSQSRLSPTAAAQEYTGATLRVYNDSWRFNSDVKLWVPVANRVVACVGFEPTVFCVRGR